ncbi:MAG: hypothetical protein L6R38_006594 [Xanthoria sp. 2 TBL-2021]|nr:MAG: hypothetical protein L6R38_006594 [Xanthoria sp. 2 TBL-2021]
MAVPAPIPQAYHGADAGQFWLVKPLAEEPAWPVFICPEEIVVEYFKKAKNRPASARRADGTFSKAYGKSQQLLPVLYLGNLRMRWAKRIQLEPLDLQAATAALDTNPNTTLANAYTEYLEQYGRNDIHYWSSRLLAKRLTEDDSGDDDEDEAGQAQAQAQLQPQAYNNAKTSEPSQLRRQCRDDESDEENLRSLIPESKRVKLESVGNASLDSIPSHASRRPSLQAGHSNYRVPFKVTAAVGDIKIKAEEVDFSKIKIYVENPYVIYSVKASSLDEASPLLASYCHRGKGDNYIWSPWLSAISADDFRPVAEFVESGEYHPYIIDAGTDGAHLAGVSNMLDKKTEVLKCGVVYTLAHQFNMPKLQALVISKLKTLQPYPAEELIAMTELAFGLGLGEEKGLDKLVVSYIVDHYFDLSAKATSLFNKLLTADGDLRNQVFATMAGTHGSKPTASNKEPKVEAVPRVGGGIEMDENVIDDENTPPSGLDHLLEFPADNGIHIYEDVEAKENAPPSGNFLRVPLLERKDLPMESNG